MGNLCIHAMHVSNAKQKLKLRGFKSEEESPNCIVRQSLNIVFLHYLYTHLSITINRQKAAYAGHICSIDFIPELTPNECRPSRAAVNAGSSRVAYDFTDKRTHLIWD